MARPSAGNIKGDDLAALSCGRPGKGPRTGAYFKNDVTLEQLEKLKNPFGLSREVAQRSGLFTVGSHHGLTRIVCAPLNANGPLVALGHPRVRR